MFLTNLKTFSDVRDEISARHGDALIHRHNLDMKTSILTYVRIRNSPPTKFNQRFKILRSTDCTYLGIRYRNDRFPYYDPDSREAVSIKDNPASLTLENFERRSDGSGISIKEDIENIFEQTSRNNTWRLEIKKYCMNFLFGPFTRIFGGTPNPPSNDVIANECTDVLDCLKQGRDVFVIGYGASGAGKTSTLVYLKFDETNGQEGIIVSIVNHKGLTQLYRYCNMSVLELFSNHSDPRKSQTDDQGRVWKLKDMKMKLINGHFQSGENEQYTNSLSQTTTDLSNMSIGQILSHVIDVDRLIKATTNNPVSSRSHVVVVLKFGKDSSTDSVGPYLIVGDFAGVENRFNCRDLDTLVRFANIKVPSTNEFYYDTGHQQQDRVNSMQKNALSPKSIHIIPITINRAEPPSNSSIYFKVSTMLEKIFRKNTARQGMLK